MRIHWKTRGLSIYHVACITVALVYYWFLISKIIKSHSHKKTLTNKNKILLNYSKNEEDIIYTFNTSDALYETIHIAIHSSDPRAVTPMFKSLLHHQQNPLHLHLIVNDPSQQDIHALISDWDLNNIQYTYYDTNKLLPHVANRSGLDKGVPLDTVLLPDVLPNIQVIVLDTDLTILCDVFELWKLFESMNTEQYIGMVKDQINLKRLQMVQPPESTYYNTGVMLLDLQKLDRESWLTLWNDSFVDTNQTNPDRCIARGSVREVVYEVECQYNLQMASILNARKCYGSDRRNVKIIHWNAQKGGITYNFRLNQLLRSWLRLDVNYFFTVRNLYLDLHQHKRKQRRCFTEDTNEALEYDNCDYFRRVKTATFLSHINCMNCKYTSTGNDVTLVVQLSLDRLLFLVRVCEFWEGPVSATVYIHYLEAKDFKQFVNSTKVLNRRNNIAYHLVYKQECMPYPVNYLRNVALDNVHSSYVFLMDVDYVPSAGLYVYLKKAIIELNPFPNKKLLVVPSFKILWRNSIPPLTKKELLPNLNKRMFPFRSPIWGLLGHRATNYSHWKKATEPYEVKWQYGYEPTIVAHRSVPRFDARFSGFGWNKAAHSLELQARGYSHLVLPEAFVVHTPHAKSMDRVRFNDRTHECILSLRDEFLKELVKKYNASYLVQAESVLETTAFQT